MADALDAGQHLEGPDALGVGPLADVSWLSGRVRTVAVAATGGECHPRTGQGDSGQDAGAELQHLDGVVVDGPERHGAGSACGVPPS